MFLAIVGENCVFYIFLVNDVLIGDDKSVCRDKKSRTAADFLFLGAILTILRDINVETRKTREHIAERIVILLVRVDVSFVLWNFFGDDDRNDSGICLFD